MRNYDQNNTLKEAFNSELPYSFRGKLVQDHHGRESGTRQAEAEVEMEAAICVLYFFFQGERDRNRERGKERERESERKGARERGREREISKHTLSDTLSLASPYFLILSK